MIWVMTLAVLILLAFLMAITMIGVTNLTLSAVGGVTVMVFIVMSFMFMMGIWLASWYNSPTANLHGMKRLRHENKALRTTIRTQDETIKRMESQIARLREQLNAPKPTPSQVTRPHPRIETRPLPATPDTGEYRLVSTPTYTPRSVGTFAAVRSSEYRSPDELT